MFARLATAFAATFAAITRGDLVRLVAGPPGLAAHRCRRRSLRLAAFWSVVAAAGIVGMACTSPAPTTLEVSPSTPTSASPYEMGWPDRVAACINRDDYGPAACVAAIGPDEQGVSIHAIGRFADCYAAARLSTVGATTTELTTDCITVEPVAGPAAPAE